MKRNSQLQQLDITKTKFGTLWFIKIQNGQESESPTLIHMYIPKHWDPLHLDLLGPHILAKQDPTTFRTPMTTIKPYTLHEASTLDPPPPRSPTTQNPKCHPDMLKLPIQVHIFTFWKVKKYYRLPATLDPHHPKSLHISQITITPELSIC